MKLKLIYGIIFLSLVFACARKEEIVVIPNYVLDKDKFSDLICDFTLAETASNINIKKVNGTKFDSVYAFNPLLENNVTKDVFDTTIYFYSHNPLLFKEVYDLSLEKLSKLQDSRKKENDKKEKKDSIR